MPIFYICSFNLYIIGEGEIRFSRTLEAVTKVAIVDLANIYCAGCKNQPLGWLIVRISYIYIYIYKLSSPSSQFSRIQLIIDSKPFVHIGAQAHHPVPVQGITSCNCKYENLNRISGFGTIFTVQILLLRSSNLLP